MRQTSSAARHLPRAQVSLDQHHKRRWSAHRDRPLKLHAAYCAAPAGARPAAARQWGVRRWLVFGSHIARHLTRVIMSSSHSRSPSHVARRDAFFDDDNDEENCLLMAVVAAEERRSAQASTTPPPAPQLAGHGVRDGVRSSADAASASVAGSSAGLVVAPPASASAGVTDGGLVANAPVELADLGPAANATYATGAQHEAHSLELFYESCLATALQQHFDAAGQVKAERDALLIDIQNVRARLAHNTRSLQKHKDQLGASIAPRLGFLQSLLMQ